MYGGNRYFENLRHSKSDGRYTPGVGYLAKVIRSALALGLVFQTCAILIMQPVESPRGVNETRRRRDYLAEIFSLIEIMEYAKKSVYSYVCTLYIIPLRWPASLHENFAFTVTSFWYNEHLLRKREE